MSAWFLQNMAWATAVMLMVLALRRPVARVFGAGPAYALWLLPLLRLVAPPLPSLGAEMPLPAPPETLIVWAEDGAPLPAAGGAEVWLPWLIALWAAGTFAFILWQWLGYRHFVARLVHGARRLGGHGGVVLLESSAVPGPIALGFIHRRIVVPADFTDRYSPDEQRLALDHEYVHHRRFDLWWNLAGLLVLALNWFNPVAWFAFRAFREDQELACDAVVAARASPEARQEYARAMIKSASRPGLIAACPLNHADQLKRRLRMMKDHRSSRLRMLGGAAAVALLAGISLSVGSAGLAQPSETPSATPPERAVPAERRQERRIIIRTEGDGPTIIHREGGEGGEGGTAETREHRTERVIVMNHRREGAGEGGDDAHARLRHGDDTIVIPSCEDGQRDEVNEGSENNRTRIVLCSRGNATPAERAERLLSVRDRLAQDSELSAEQRARVSAALDREIARLRGQ